jgi:hypothetical protein
MNAKPRYKAPRKCLQWNTDELMCLKMLVYWLRVHEPKCRDKIELWQRTTELCPRVLQAVLRVSKTFEEVRSET